MNQVIMSLSDSDSDIDLMIKNYEDFSETLQKLRDVIMHCFEHLPPREVPVELTLGMKEVFKFLNWKREKIPTDFTGHDTEIVEQRNIKDYFSLSEKACMYTKELINKYTEQIWLNRVRNEYSAEGYQHVPTPSCNILPIPTTTSRQEEVLMMSLFYPNNLFNSNMYRNTYQVESPLCRKCHQEEETPFHIVVQCSDNSEEVKQLLQDILGEEELKEDTTTLLKGSRDQRFLELCLDIISQQNYSVHVDLNA